MENKLSDKKLLKELKSRIKIRKQAFSKLRQLNNELREANIKLMESEQLKSNFLSNVRNEIINPLSSILSLAQSIAFADDITAQASKKLAATIYNEAFDLDYQMKNIFASAEIEAGEANVENYSLDLVDLAKKEIIKFKKNAHEKEIKLTFDNVLNKKSFIIQTDPVKLELILDNLIVNAIHWSNKKGHVALKIAAGEKQITLSVADNGPGIKKDDQKAIFDRFKSLDPTVHSLNKGHGLGLSIANAYADLLGGEIKLESKPGAGSTFYLMLNNTPQMEPSNGTSETAHNFLFSNGTELF